MMNLRKNPSPDRKMTLLVAVCLFLALGVSTESTAEESSSDSSTKFAELSDRFIKEALARSPSEASQAGYHKHLDEKTGKTVELDGVLDDMSLESIYDDLIFYKDWRSRFHKETPVQSLKAQDAADWRLIDDQIGLYLLEMDKIQNYRHNPTVVVELIGSAIFQPLTASYAPKEKRLSHVLSRIEQIPRVLDQVKRYLDDVAPVYIETAIKENAGNVELIEKTVASAIPEDSPLKTKFNDAAPPAISALKDFSTWLEKDLAKRPSTRGWRLGKTLYDQKFKLVMQTAVSPEELLADAEKDLKFVRTEMYKLAKSLHKKMFKKCDHSGLKGRALVNKVISEVLDEISDDHADRNRLLSTIESDLDSIKKFIRAKRIVSLSDRDNLKVIPTPPFMRGIYAVAGFHSAPPLEPEGRAEYWVTPIEPGTPDDKAESKLREYNNYTLKWLTIHEALPGHYIQFEHLNSLQPKRRRLLRSLYGNGAYIEGWAEYIAEVMMNEGFMNNDPKFRIMMRKIRLRLLANTILDIKMHTKNMTDQQALDLMIKDAFQTKAEAEAKLVRAKLSSTQLPTYYVGLREWQNFRKRFQEKRGRDFELMEFHNAALALGPLPVSVVEELVMDNQ